MVGVRKGRTAEAFGAIIPIRALKTFVVHAIDLLIAAIT
jgi:hypothetical protein